MMPASPQLAQVDGAAAGVHLSTMRSSPFRSGLAAALTLLAAATSVAQTPPALRPATLSGTVSAMNGEVLLPGVSIAVYADDGRPLSQVTSDGAGWFTIPALPSGAYVL
jgi:hypothetical protein